MSSQSRHHSGSTILTCSQSYEKPFIFQSLILVCSNYSDYSVWFSYLRIDKVIGTNDSCTQFFRHLPRQQTVNGSISGAPRSPVDEHHQRRRHTFGPVYVWRVVQVQLVASAAKCDALCVQTRQKCELQHNAQVLHNTFWRDHIESRDTHKSRILFFTPCKHTFS